MVRRGAEESKPGEGLLDCIHDITAALVFAKMTDSTYRVDTISRLAQWRIHILKM